MFWLLLIVIILAVVFFLGPREPRGWTMPNLAIPEDPQSLDAYLADKEQGHPIKPGLEKQVRWAFEDKRKTETAIVFLHGYTASNLELDPVIRQLADKIGANIYFVRYAGHSLTDDGEKLAQVTFADWVNDTAEALTIGKQIGEKVIVASSSTGGSMAIWGAQHMADKIDGFIFSAPNFKINNPLQSALTLPWARLITKLTQPEKNTWEPQANWDEAMIKQAQHSSMMSFYTVSVLPVGVAALQARRAKFEDIQIPALFIVDARDKTVYASETIDKAYPRWGHANKRLLELDSHHENHHIMAGDLCTPQSSQEFLEVSLDFVQRL